MRLKTINIPPNKPAVRLELLSELFELLVPHVLEGEHISSTVIIQRLLDSAQDCFFMIPPLLLGLR